MSNVLFQAIKSFRQAHPEWSTPEGAHDQCWWASIEFQEHLDSLGLLVGDEQGDSWDLEDVRAIRGVYHLDTNAYANHWVMRVGDIFIDWTARQLNPKAPFPLVKVGSQVVLA